MAQKKTPGVYIVEKNAFPNSVVEVPTAVPAFIGYTQKALNGTKSLHKKPWRISSMLEYQTYFGFGPDLKYGIEAVEDPKTSPYDFKLAESNEAKDGISMKAFALTVPNAKKEFLLYNSMRHFFANGGGPCYIVSVGDYDDEISKGDLEAGIGELLLEDEPTMLVMPEAVRLPDSECFGLQEAMLNQCGKLMSRVTLLDVYNGFKARTDPDGDPIDAFREGMGTNFPSYGMAYYPWLNTSVVSSSEVNFSALEAVADLKAALEAELEASYLHIEEVKGADINALTPEQQPMKKDLKNYLGIKTELDKLDDEEFNKDPKREILHQTLSVISEGYREVIEAVQRKMNLLPPSAAMAGIYTLTDNTRGVWKAPANTAVASVITPTVNITHDDQEDLNVTPQGKSINAIRSFVGEGIKVWGARTLDGNSQDWRYINVRRTMIMLEQSIMKAAKAFVFEPNTANTWTSMKAMISNFLTDKWKEGALVGASPSEAFQVNVGLGSTMTANDILDGYMNITVLVAISRPAEFIVITFQQQMQKS